MSFSPEKWVSWQEYRDSVYVFHEASKKVFVFSDTARDFWMAALSGGGREEMTQLLCRKYGEQHHDEISEDLSAFLEELESSGLVREVQ